MYYRIEEILDFIKSKISLSDNQVGVILESDYFKNLLSKYSDIKDRSMAATLRVNNALNEPFLSDILVHALKAIGEKDCIHEIALVSLDPPQSYGESNDYNLRLALKESLKRTFTENVNIDEFLETVSVMGVKRASKYHGLEKYEDAIQRIILRYIDMHEIWEIYNGDAYLNLLDCQEILQKDVKVAIQLLKRVYNLSDEQVYKLEKCRYKLDRRLSATQVFGVYTHLSNMVSVNINTPKSIVQVLIHEMLHALGLNSEGVVEFLSQKAFFDCYEDVFAYDKNELDISDKNSYIANLFLERSFEPGEDSWSYYTISSKFYKLFNIFVASGIDKKSIDMWLTGNSYPFLHLMPELSDFYVRTSKVQEEYYKYTDRDTTVIHEYEKTIDNVLEDVSKNIGSIKTNIRRIQNSLNEFSLEKTGSDFIKLKEDLFLLIFSELGKKFCTSVVNGTAKKHLEEQRELYLTNNFGSSFECLEEQVEDFNSIVTLLLKKFKIPKKVMNFLINIDSTSIDETFYILKKSDFCDYSEEPVAIDIYDSYKASKVSKFININGEFKSIDELSQLPVKVQISTSDTIKSIVDKYNVASHSRKNNNVKEAITR